MTIKIPDVSTLIRMHVTKALPRLLAAGRVDLANYNSAQLQELRDAGVQIPGLEEALADEGTPPAAEPVAETKPVVETDPKRGDDPNDIAAAAKELAGVIPLPESMANAVCEKYNVFTFQVVVAAMGYALDSNISAFRPQGAREMQRQEGETLAALGYSDVQIHRMTSETMQEIVFGGLAAKDCSILSNGDFTAFSPDVKAPVPAPVAALAEYVEPEPTPLAPYPAAAALFTPDLDAWKAAIRKAGISGRVTSRFVNKALAAGEIAYDLVDGVLQPQSSSMIGVTTMSDADVASIVTEVTSPKDTLAEVLADQLAAAEGVAAVLEDIMAPEAPAPVLKQEKAPVLYLSWGVSGTKLLLDGRMTEIVNFAKEIGVDLRI